MLFSVWLLFVVALGQPNYLGSPFIRIAALQGAYVLLFAVYGFSLLGNRRLVSSLPVDGAALAFLLTLFIASIAAANRQISLESASLSIAPLIALYALYDARSLTPARLMRVLVVTGVVMAIFGVLQEVRSYLSWLNIASTVDGGFRIRHLLPPQLPRSGGLMHENDQAVILDLILPFALYLAVWPCGRFDRVLGIGGSFVIAAGTFVTFTRGGWLGLVAAGFVFGVLYLLSTRRSLLDSLTSLPWRRIGIVAGVAAIGSVVVAVAAWSQLSGFVLRDTASLRMEAAAKAVKIFSDHPLTGVGPNGFGLFYDSYGGENVVNNVHPHNAYLSVLVDTGVIGALLMGAGAIVVCAWILSAFVAGSASQRLVLSTCVASAVTVLVHGLVLSPQLFNPALLVSAVIMAIALKSAPVEESSHWLLRVPPLRFAVVGLLPVLVLAWFVMERPNAAYDDSLLAYRDGRTAEAVDIAVKAAATGRPSAAYLINAGTLQAELYRTAGRRQDLEEAAAYFGRATEVEPRGAIPHADYALALMQLGEIDAASTEAADALRLSPNNVEIAAIAGSVFEAAGDQARAIDAWSRVLRSQPRLAQSPFWGVSAMRMTMRAQALEEAGVNACVQGKVTVLFGTYPSELPQLLDACRSAGKEAREKDPSALAYMLYASGDAAGLRDLVGQLRASLPGTGSTLVSSALLAATGGDAKAMRDDLLVASASNSLDAPLLLAATYGSATGTKDVSPLLRVPSTSEPLPSQVLRYVQGVEPQVDGFARPWTALEARNYFQIDLLRRAPAIIFVYGEWQQLMSPRPLTDPVALR